jgi:hypothetical protein
MTDETQLMDVNDILRQIKEIEDKISNNRVLINSPDTGTEFKTTLIDDNKFHMDKLTELNKELDKWKK